MAINLNPAGEILNRYGLLRARFLVIAAAIVLVGAYVFLRGGGQEEDMFITVEASRGDISYNIASTGILQAVITVQVGSQVSGRIQELHADFNSVVKKGQILAVIDPASFDAQLARSRAAVAMAKANVKNAEATLANRGAELESSKANLTAAQVASRDAKSGMERNRGLFEADLVSEHALGTHVLRQPGIEHRGLDIFPNRRSRQQVETLKNEADFLIPNVGALGSRQVGGVDAVKQVGAFARPVQAAHQVEQGRFA